MLHLLKNLKISLHFRVQFHGISATSSSTVEAIRQGVAHRLTELFSTSSPKPTAGHQVITVGNTKPI